VTLADESREIIELLAAGRDRRVDDRMRELHRRYHDRPLDHVRVHRLWIRVHVTRRAYLRALGHAFAGYVVAAPASLVQRHTGLVVPAFDDRR
jgi:hypothetical protein